MSTNPNRGWLGSRSVSFWTVVGGGAAVVSTIITLAVTLAPQSPAKSSDSQNNSSTPSPLVLPSATPSSPADSSSTAINQGGASVYLSQLQPLNDSSIRNDSREIGGTPFPNTVYTDVSGCNGGDTSRRYEYNLGKHYRQFVANLGVDDKAPDSVVTIQFETFVDGVSKSKIVKDIGTSQKISVDVTDGLRLRIMATLVHASEKYGCDKDADWGDAMLVGASGEVPPASQNR